MIASWFVHPVTLSFTSLLWLIIPLCVSVSVVYKTIRTGDLRRLPLQIAGLVGYIVVGLTLLCVALYLVQEFWP